MIDTKIDKLKKIWSKIPEIDCKKECGALCKVNHAFAFDIDNLVLEDQLGNNFVKMPDIHDVLENGIEHKFHKNSSCCNCPYFSNGLCSIYEIRPTICRLYGTMGECPYGCKPKKGSKYMTKEELLEVIADLRKIDPDDQSIIFFEEDISSYFA